MFIGLLKKPQEKSDWRLIKFSLLLAYCLQNPLANGKQGLMPEEMSQTLLTNKKQEKHYYHANHIIKPA
jgi:hypothetical protein